MLRSDNEPAMLALIADALRGLRVELDLETVAAEGSFPYDPQTNGAAKVAETREGLIPDKSAYFGAQTPNADPAQPSSFDMVDSALGYPSNDTTGWSRWEDRL